MPFWPPQEHGRTTSDAFSASVPWPYKSFTSVSLSLMSAGIVLNEFDISSHSIHRISKISGGSLVLHLLESAHEE